MILIKLHICLASMVSESYNFFHMDALPAMFAIVLNFVKCCWVVGTNRTSCIFVVFIMSFSGTCI